jgi:hypothetical protein
MHKPAHIAAIYEADDAIHFGKERVILAAAYVLAGFQTRAALADDNRSAGDELSAESFHSKPLCI